MRSPSWMELSLPVAALLLALALALSLAWLFLLGRANGAIGLIGSINGSGSLHRDTEWDRCRQDRGEGGGADRVRACVRIGALHMQQRFQVGRSATEKKSATKRSQYALVPD